MRHAIAGTVIHGTLLNADLIEAFTTELEDRSVGEDDPRIKSAIMCGNNLCGLICMYGRNWANYPDPDNAERISYTLETLMDLIDELAPEGYYFGAHEGDGSDFGYWPVDPDA